MTPTPKTTPFERAVRHVRRADAEGAVDNATKLRLYGLYKQATVGDVRGEAPSAIYWESRAKHDAWALYKGVRPERAKGLYVAALADADHRFKP